MAIKLNLNTQPYYDDFAENSEFYKVLFRPGFSIQARELTTLQTILQNQVERFGSHMFEEGAMVIPGQVALDTEYHAVKIQSSYNLNNVESYRTDYVGTIITGETSGVKAKVVNTVTSTTTDSLTLYVKYESSGTNNTDSVFADGENISSSGIVGTFNAGTLTATTDATDATSIGSSASIAQGVYFTRGHFVKCFDETIILDKYTNTPSYRIGFDITESLVTPEGDTSLLDNATGVSNFSAKGAHRLKINVKLVAKELTSVDDTDFIELLRVDNGTIISKVIHTDYAFIEETLARRTFDESGDYTVQDFDIEPREHLDTGLNRGVYTLTNGGDDTKVSLGISPGKAYVRGYEIETLSTQFIDVDKARKVASNNNTVTPASLGNYVKVTNTFGSPDLTLITGESEPFKKVTLYDEVNTTRGSVNGFEIGYARTRAFEYLSGSLGGSSTSTDGVYKLYLFDIQMKTTLMTNSTATFSTDARITGSTTGAYGYVDVGATSGSFELIQVSGTFLANETLTSSVSTDTTGVTVSALDVKDFSMAKSVFMDDPDAGQDFTADIILGSSFTLSGTLSTTISGSQIFGYNTQFMNEVRIGDIISIPSSNNDVVTVTSVASGVIDVSPATTITGTFTGIRTRSKLNEQEELVMIYKLPKDNIKTLLTDSNNGISDTTLSTKRQFIGTTTSSSNIAFTSGTNEVFGSFSTTDYVLSVLSVGTGAGAGNMAQGDIIDLTGKVTGLGTSSITITDTTAFGTIANKIKLVATINRTTASHKSKTAYKSIKKLITDTTSSSNIFGSRVSDPQISLGTADAYGIRGIFLSNDMLTAPSTPTLTFSSVTSTIFNAGERIVGDTTGAIGIVISYTSSSKVLEYYVLSGTFTTADTITYNTTDTATLDSTATGGGIGVGDIDVTSSFTFDTGQRDSYYDISNIVRKGSAVTPAGQMLIIYDYFSHGGSGDFFSVDSYASQVDYMDIPSYSATRVDPDTLAPSGEYELRDSLDFRSRVGDNTATNPFVFRNRDYASTGSSRYDIPKVDSLIRSDYENYLNRIDHLYLTSDGDFIIQKGIDAEIPTAPDTLESVMKIVEIDIPAYTHSSGDLIITRTDNSRYTMRDIGRLDKRIGNLEYYTSLNMLEQNTQSLQIQDANGLDRFKSGFIVDNFSGHSVGDVIHSDYNCSIDFEAGTLRPDSYQDNIELTEYNTSDTQRSASSYTKTGDIIMLPYEHKVMISQGFASRVENVNPFAIQTWIGVCKLGPSSDTWIDTKKAPDVVINAEGNYNSVLAKERNRLGTIWNSWRTVWTGTNRSTGIGARIRTQNWRRVRNRGLWARNGTRGWARNLVQRTNISASERQVRTGTNTRLIESRERKLSGTKVIEASIIPFMRSKNINVNITGMKPNTRIYPFFDNVAVSNYFKTSGGGSGPFVTDGAGAFLGMFTLPNNNSIRFRVGKKTLRLTDVSNNDMTAGIADTSAEGIYESTGTLNTVQSTFLSLRNARVVRSSVSERRTVTTTRTEDRVVGWWDPLAQTFLVEKPGGCFITKVDLFFQSKDTNLPVTMMIRSVENGMPAKSILPFSTVVLNPDQVNLSDNGLTSTTFTFDSPVYLKDREEYCVVVQTSSTDYKCWISQVGEKDINSTRSISEQPYMGVLFKSQNSSTWTASQMEDLKFTMYNAKFDTSKVCNVKLVNKELTVDTGHIDTLDNQPISTEAGISKVRIYQENHGMHSTSSNVIISGVVAPTGETGTLADIPLTEINKTHISISDIEVDSYCVTTTQAANKSITAGGDAVLATRNVPYDVLHPIVAVMDFPDTTISASLQNTAGTSLAGNEYSYVKTSEYGAPNIILNEDIILDKTSIIASKINETNEMNGADSIDVNISLSTSNENISPIIDTERMSVITIANRVDKIDTSADIGDVSNYVSSTEADGDNNPAVYMIKKVTLELPATALRTMMASAVEDGSSIEIYYKTLRSDSADNFDDIGWVAYNTAGESDSIVPASKDPSDFKDYLYTVSDLPSFIAFSIKIVMKSTDSTKPPLIKDFRTIALEL